MHLQINYISLKADLFSKHLERKVRLRIFAPPLFWDADLKFPVLLMNDGQDFNTMNLEETLNITFSSSGFTPFIYVGIEANANRLQEYGTAVMPDFKGRGARALKYSKFITQELIPLLQADFKASRKKEDWVFCGMSLGGLSAFDTGFNYAGLFGKIGVLSGSFWWRKKAFAKGDLQDRSRIVLDMVKNAPHAPHLKFWFMCGSLDEKSDRNNNGIIDSIDDTLDLIKELQLKGYRFPGEITYFQVEGGRHNQATWGQVFPEFLKWAFARKK